MFRWHWDFGLENVEVCKERRYSKRWLLYIACPVRPRVDMIHVSQAFRRADAPDMKRLFTKFWLVSHML